MDLEKGDHPIVAQIWGLNPDNFEKAARDIKKMGFDGIDINMGCPDRTVTKNGCCSALINNPEKAAKIIQATQKGAGTIPVSVKTRIGFNEVKTEDWITFLLKQNLSALIIHGRIAKHMSEKPADWDEIKKAVLIRNKLKSKTLIIGNGDVLNREDGIKKAKASGVDGVMIGRGIFKDLWAFSPIDQKPKLNNQDMLSLLMEHARQFNQKWQGKKNFLILRKFFKIYVSDFQNAGVLRGELMESKNLEEVEAIIAPRLI